MAGYKKILVALDLTDESNFVLNKTKEIARLYDAELYSAHIIEPISYAYGGDIPMDLSEVQEELDEHARQKLNSLSERANIPKDNQFITIGRPNTEIHKIAKNIEADLIIVGSHGRHGLQLLLGSTANAVLHGTHCDVLAVKISD